MGTVPSSTKLTKVGCLPLIPFCHHPCPWTHTIAKPKAAAAANAPLHLVGVHLFDAFFPPCRSEQSKATSGLVWLRLLSFFLFFASMVPLHHRRRDERTPRSPRGSPAVGARVHNRCVRKRTGCTRRRESPTGDPMPVSLANEPFDRENGFGFDRETRFHGDWKRTSFRDLGWNGTPRWSPTAEREANEDSN